jgi:hypothetical protein
LYFKDKNKTLLALHNQIAGQLAHSFGSVFTTEHPAKIPEAVGYMYLEFALEYPGLFELKFVLMELMGPC